MNIKLENFELNLQQKDVKFTLYTEHKKTPKIKQGHCPLSRLTHQLSGARKRKKHRARREGRMYQEIFPIIFLKLD